MAEAIGVSGAAVGVASLGIQVCQGLLSYYTAYRNQNSEIKAICVRIEGLRNILNYLKGVLPNARPDGVSATRQVEQAIMECAASIANLEDQVKKFHR